MSSEDSRPCSPGSISSSQDIPASIAPSSSASLSANASSASSSSSASQSSQHTIQYASPPSQQQQQQSSSASLWRPGFGSRLQPDSVLDSGDALVKREILSMISQYLESEGYTASSMALQDEAQVKLSEQSERRAFGRRMVRCILDADWAEVEKMCTSSKNNFRNSKAFLYAAYKQQYLEAIESGEYQKAFTHLTRRLKPLESLQSHPGEFRELCYLLTCRSAQEAATSFRGFDAAAGPGGGGREQLVEQFQSMFNLDAVDSGFSSAVSPAAAPASSSSSAPPAPLIQNPPPNRLVQLLQQAAAYQILQVRQHPRRTSPKVSSLFSDYTCFVIPNAQRAQLGGHRANVKCVEFLGDQGNLLASGASDNMVRLFASDSSSSSKPLVTLSGHSSRVWSLSSNKIGDRLASAGGDGLIKIWSVPTSSHYEEAQCVATLSSTGIISESSASSSSSSSSSMYSSLSRQLSSASLASSSDASSGSSSKEGISSSSSNSNNGSAYGGGDIYSVKFHPSQTHLVSGGYDKEVRMYDARTGQLVKTFSGHTGPVCSVIFNPHGSLIISGGKDNTIKFWDVVSGLCVKTLSQYLGEVTSVELNSAGTQLLSCSKDNANRLWDLRTSRPIQRFKGHQNTYKNFVRASFGPDQSVVMSGSEDGYVYIWDVETGKILQRLGGHSGTVYDVVWNSRQSLLASCSDDNAISTWWFDERIME